MIAPALCNLVVCVLQYRQEGKSVGLNNTRGIMAKKSQDKDSQLSTKSKIHSKHVRMLFLIFGFSLTVFGFVQLFDRYSTVTGNPILPNASEVVVVDDEEPDEAKPDVAQYSVPADQPRRILIPSINTEGIIQKVGLTSENAVAVPSNIHFAGWYTGSVKPGEPGLSIIDGHVSGRFADGIFKDLSKLKLGDSFSIEFGDLRSITFQVVDVKTLPESESANLLFDKRQDIESQLNLITCGGNYDKQAETFEDRVIVVAKRV
jgi:LPXTG-site transpeptidase (sortase) family protein